METKNFHQFSSDKVTTAATHFYTSSLVPHSMQDFGRADQESQLTTILKTLVESQHDSNLPPPHVETFDGSKAIEYPAFIKKL